MTRPGAGSPVIVINGRARMYDEIDYHVELERDLPEVDGEGHLWPAYRVVAGAPARITIKTRDGRWHLFRAEPQKCTRPSGRRLHVYAGDGKW